ncbi:uncharacterized protein LOC106532736 [Tachysurus ichikawai]
MVSRTVFFRIQDHFCVDSIQKFWDDKREETINQLQSKDSVVLCDGRMDSPGFCAQYCTYSAMERRKGRTFQTLQREVKLTETCTYAHTEISAIFNPDKGQLRNTGVHHSLDVWHSAKNLSKRGIRWLTTMTNSLICGLGSSIMLLVSIHGHLVAAIMVPLLRSGTRIGLGLTL